MKALIIAIIALFISTFATAQFTPTDNNEIRTAKFYFACNSSTVYSVDAMQLQEMANSTIVSIDGYASIEGNIDANLTLSTNRVETVRQLLRSEIIANSYGPTEKFGPSRKENRIVIVTYSISKATNTSIRETVDVEGFTCGNHIDPSVYFADTLDIETVDTTSIIPEPVVLETIEPSILSSIDTVSIAKISIDTFFLPTRQAVRFQMKHHGMSRSQAIASVEARKDQWKPISKKKKATKRKRLPRKTMGKNDSIWSHLFPFRGC